MASRVEIVREDVLKVDVGEANVVTLYLTSYGMDKVRLKLEEELKPGARVVSRHYQILEWKLITVYGNIYLYQLGKSEMHSNEARGRDNQTSPFFWV